MRLPLLAAYDSAWRLLLPGLRALAFLDGLSRTVGAPLLPARWHVADRLGGARALPARGTSPEPALWMHCASLGEAKGLWALAEILSDGEGPGPGRILLTVNTDAGLEYLRGKARRYRDARRPPGPPETRGRVDVVAAPFNHPGLARRFVDAHRIIGFCLYEVELWPNYIRACREKGIPTAWVSARFTAKAEAAYKPFRDALSPFLDGFAWIMAQGAADAARLRSFTRAPVIEGFDFKAAAYFSGNAGVDGAAGVSAPGKEDSRNGFAFISLHLGELRRLLPGLPGLMERFDLLVFPRHAKERAAFEKALEPLGFRMHSRDPRARHLIVDSFGAVSRMLPRCSAAFVGGSLVPRGCHNLWEPLLAGLKIYFGPSLHNQEEMARDLIAAGIAEKVEDPAEARRWPLPPVAVEGLCRRYAEDRSLRLRAAGELFRGRMRGVLPGFYLFSDPVMQPTRSERT